MNRGISGYMIYQEWKKTQHQNYMEPPIISGFRFVFFLEVFVSSRVVFITKQGLGYSNLGVSNFRELQLR